MSNIFFTGCTHFGHANIIKLANRPFSSVEEMNQVLIDRWNAKVGKNDIVYHLGDVGWFKTAIEAERLLRSLNGHIRVIGGNHDDGKQFSIWANYEELKLKDHQLVLFHYPIEDWNGRWKGSIHLHCHTHAPEFHNPRIPHIEQEGKIPSRYPPELKCNRFNVGVDATGFAPVELEVIIREAYKHA